MSTTGALGLTKAVVPSNVRLQLVELQRKAIVLPPLLNVFLTDTETGSSSLCSYVRSNSDAKIKKTLRIEVKGARMENRIDL